MDGWISVHRKIQENWIWNCKEPYDKRSAWIDLLLSVNHKKASVNFDNEIYEIEPGQMITSLTKLAKKWRWSRHKVSDYLRTLEKERMLVQVRDSKKTLISIENYGKYQCRKESTDTSEDILQERTTDMSRTQTIMIIIYIIFILIY